VSYPDTSHSPEEYRFVILRFYPRKALHARPGFPGVHNSDKVRLWPRTKLQRLELAVPPGPRVHLHAASAFLQSANSSSSPYLRVLLKQNSASAPKPSHSSQTNDAGPRISYRPALDPLRRHLRSPAVPFRPRIWIDFVPDQPVRGHRNHASPKSLILQQQSYELSNQPTLSLKLLLVLYSRSSPLEQQADHVWPLPPTMGPTRGPEPEGQVSHRTRCKKSSALHRVKEMFPSFVIGKHTQCNRPLEARCVYSLSKDSMAT
jgi:hypothetical protein